MAATLNSFQRTMLQWDAVHPYHAVHVVRLPGAPDRERLQDAIDTTLFDLGLTGCTLDRRRGSLEFRGGTVRCELKWIEGGEAEPATAHEVERQLNTRFETAGEAFNPFRFFVVTEADRFGLGVAYFHAVADGYSMVFLMRDIVGRYRGSGRVLIRRRFPEGNPGSLWRQPGWVLEKVAMLPGFMRNMRSSCRPLYRDPMDLQTGFEFLAPRPGQLREWLETARAWGVTLHDLLLTLLLNAVAPLAPDRPATRRRCLSVGSIVDLRKDLALEDPGIFGLFLGSFIVTHEVPEGIGLRALAEEVRAKTRWIKDRRAYRASSLDLALGRVMFALNSPAGRKRLYQRYYPLWGGVTNMNLNPLWTGHEEALPIDYLRAPSTGPATPLVLSLTTMGDRVRIGLTYRTAVYSREDIERVKEGILQSMGPAEGRS